MEYVERCDIVNLYSTGTLHGLATCYVINCYLLRNCNLSPFHSLIILTVTEFAVHLLSIMAQLLEPKEDKEEK